MTRHHGLSLIIYINIYSIFVSINATADVGHHEVPTSDFPASAFAFSCSWSDGYAKNPYISSSLCLMQSAEGQQIN